MRLTGKQKILIHLYRHGRCHYKAGQMRTEFSRRTIFGQSTWRDHLFLEGMIQSDRGALDPKAKNIWTRRPQPGEEIYLTPEGEAEAERLLRKIGSE